MKLGRSALSAATQNMTIRTLLIALVTISSLVSALAIPASPAPTLAAPSTLTYTDRTYGFGFSYPSTLTLRTWKPAADILASISFANAGEGNGGDDGAEISVTVFRKDTRDSLWSWTAHHRTQGSGVAVVRDRKTAAVFEDASAPASLTVDGHPALMFAHVTDQHLSHRLLIDEGRRVLSVTLTGASASLQSAFQEIASTMHLGLSRTSLRDNHLPARLARLLITQHPMLAPTSTKAGLRPHTATLLGYLLPYSAGATYRIMQGWGGTVSHTCPGTMCYAYDFDMPDGTRVVASRAGTVAYTADGYTACGGSDYANLVNRVTINHTDGTATLYLHLSRVDVAPGTSVAQGQQIGLSGHVGWTYCTPHLHFQRQTQGASWFTQSQPVYFDEYPGAQLAQGSYYTSANNGQPVPTTAAVALRSDGASGYSLDVYGNLHPFGGAPAVSSGVSWTFAIARGLVLRADGQSGYILDGWGGIHPFGGAPAVTPSAYWSGWDIARGIALGPDGQSGYVVDGWGGLHPFGNAPAVTPSAYWSGWDIARGITLRSDGVSGYVVDGYGGVHPFGGAPAVGISAYWSGWDIARGIVMADDGHNLNFPANSGYVLDGYGGLHPFNGAPQAPVGGYWSGQDRARGFTFLPGVNAGAYSDGFGNVAIFHATITPMRAVAMRPDGLGGYALDGYGGLHAFGGAPAVSSGVSLTLNLARGLVLRANGQSGYILDGYGGIHAFGGAPAVTPSAYWSGWDIARGIVLGADGQSGYVLDGYGGLHPFGNAPAVTPSAYWSGWDIARGITLRSDGVSGYVLDGYGGLHPFGNAPAVAPSAYWSGSDLARSISLLSDGQSGYVFDAFGGIHPFGNAPAAAVTGYWSGADVLTGSALAPTATTTSASGFTVNVAGEVRSFSS